MRGVDWQNLIGGLALGALGVFFILGAGEMRIGTAQRMGPGYFPLMLGWIAVAIALLLAVPALFRSGAFPVPALRPTIAVLAGIAAFAITMRSFGLIAAVAVTVLVSSLADRNAHPLGAVILAVVLGLASWLIFVRGLGLAMPVFRTPF